ncbi:MAG: hypothetical protein IT437_03945 [Phycisphaerales bacterium]|nr:hypothetical protein [Phycisphaerales bacterium]
MARTVPLDLLDSLRVASPCHMAWEAMRPVDGDRVRHCGACGLDVFNLSALPRAEAEALVRSRLGAGRFCVQMHLRADGTLITRDCPVGLRRARQRLVRGVSRAAAAVVFVLGGFAVARSREKQAPGLWRVQPFATVCDWVRPAAPAAPLNVLAVRGEMVMGRLVAPAPVQPSGGGAP